MSCHLMILSINSKYADDKKTTCHMLPRTGESLSEEQGRLFFTALAESLEKIAS